MLRIVARGLHNVLVVPIARQENTGENCHVNNHYCVNNTYCRRNGFRLWMLAFRYFNNGRVLPGRGAGDVLRAGG